MAVKADDIAVPVPAEIAEDAPPSRATIVLRKMWQLRLGVFGGFLILILVCTAVFAPYVATHDPFEQDILERLNVDFEQTLHNVEISAGVGIRF